MVKPRPLRLIGLRAARVSRGIEVRHLEPFLTPGLEEVGEEPRIAPRGSFPSIGFRIDRLPELRRRIAPEIPRRQAECGTGPADGDSPGLGTAAV